MIAPSPALLIACASGRLIGRFQCVSCALDLHARFGSFREQAADDESASIKFINAVGYWAHYDHDVGESSWPLPHCPTADSLARFGLQRRVLFERPEVGDLAVVWSPPRVRFTRVSIITSAAELDDDGLLSCLTLGAHRRGMKARPERFNPAGGDRFLRWARLERLPGFVTRSA